MAKTRGVVADVNLATDNCYAMMEQLKICSLKKSEDELLAINKELKEVEIYKKDLSQSEITTAADKVVTVADTVATATDEEASVETGEPEVSDASVKNTDGESTNLSGSLPNEPKVEKLVSVESEVEINKKDLSQSSKELSEVEIYQKGLSQTNKEGSSDDSNDESADAAVKHNLGNEKCKSDEGFNAASLSEDDADMKGVENLVKDASNNVGTLSKDVKVKTPAERDQVQTPAKEVDDFDDVSKNETATEYEKISAVSDYCTPRSCGSAMTEPAAPAVQASSEPEQPDAAPTESVTEVIKEVSEESEECTTATTPVETVVVPEVMVPDITAEAEPIAEEVIEINSSEVSAPKAVVSPEPAAVDVAEEKEPLTKEEEAITPIMEEPESKATPPKKEASESSDDKAITPSKEVRESKPLLTIMKKVNLSRERSRTTRRISPRARRKPVVMILTKNPLMLKRIKLARRMIPPLQMLILSLSLRLRLLLLRYLLKLLSRSRTLARLKTLIPLMITIMRSLQLMEKWLHRHQSRVRVKFRRVQVMFQQKPKRSQLLICLLKLLPK